MTTYNLVAAGDSITQTVRTLSSAWQPSSTLVTVGDTSALRVGDLITADNFGNTSGLVGQAITQIVNATQIRTAVTNPFGSIQSYDLTFRSIWKYDQTVKDALAALYPGDTWNLVNNGVSGWTSQNVWSNFATVIGDESPSVVLLMIGTNDAYRAREGADGSAGYSPLTVRSRVESIIRASRALTGPDGKAARVVLMTPPPATEQADGFTLWRHQETLNGIAGAVMDAAAGIGGVTVIDLWRLMQQANASWKTAYLYDGLHVGDDGHDLIATYALAAVLAELKGVIAPTSRRIDPVASFATSRVITSAGITVTLTPATETDAPVALSFAKHATLTPATETDAAVAITSTKRVTLTPAVETDRAVALSIAGAVLDGPRVPLPATANFVSARSQTANFASAKSQSADFAGNQGHTADFIAGPT